MIRRLFNNTQSLTGRLELFFLLVSVVIGLLCFALVSGALLWSEDRVGERRIMIDKKEAIEHFRNHPDSGIIKLDLLTTAYNDINLVPELYQPFIQDKKYFLAEVADEPDTRMIYMSTYTQDGEEHPIILISLIDEIEITSNEFMFVLVMVLAVVIGLLLIFGSLLSRLSLRLIEPVSALKTQLDRHQGDTTQKFVVPEGSANEFQTLANQLNEYRHQINQVIKREQAFARYASHELRTPLTVMKGSSSLLARSPSTSFQERQIGRIQDATLQMSTMVDALLGLVRYERNTDDSPVRTISEQELHNIVALSQAQADEKSLEFNVQILGHPQTKATTAVLNITLSNLIRNGIAATSAGTIHITMTDTTLSVRDEGEGFSSVPDAEGHGLGLMIVDDLCRRYGWQFTIDTHPNDGCVATIDLSTEVTDGESQDEEM
ncbi:HAMP domain-containing histidine kinase [Vibrio diabolicus]|jgi:signal transduction histidine kinase|uniref:histidine kinase n=2 Tax=Vibrio TaxID=662 RepID=A0ABX1HR46_9VIBR|nr:MULTISPECIES: HAMP domain-containing sensor histidine kinase [Vibrio]MCR9495634.1 HAMP domain-containing histidine kinase [Vibrio alginolyticus]MCS0028871.1 HAMP domain-containing histidine kinase [Vibrio alginolyticus]MCS0317724.1 HAMP domain-containing histidine kinase [Vibrio diabolicus]MCS0433276.1 HAMP domain-containing histidine kinase [Vibrio diabolicus]NKJ66642.1 HAMP domain-containing histidine kinase [Vibrio chemaguriensis]